MGLEQLPDELLLTLTEQWSCREQQLRQLSALLHPTRPSPSTIVAYGPHATGKSSILKAYLGGKGLQHAIIQCRECVTGRHLLERTVAAVHAATQEDVDGETEGYIGRCENISALAVHLQRLLAKQDKFVLVFDGIDRQREAPPTLLPALARLGEMIPSLAIVLIVQHPPPRFLHQTGVPHLHFPPYTRNQSIHIISRNPADIFLAPPPEELDYDEQVHEEDKAWLWPRFCAAVWDSLAQNAARDLVAFREVCHKLWRPFVAPIIKGDFGTRDFSRLLVAQRRLFQDESVLLDSIITSQPAAITIQAKNHGHELPYYAKWLLIAAYLASFNPARLDALYFMKSTERKRRKKGGGTARSGGGRPSQNRKIPRHLLAASAFTLDRLLSILHAILPHDLRSTIDVYTQIATLTSLRLLVRSSGMGSSDPLEAGGKWKTGPAVSWEYVQGLARSLDFGIVDYIAE
ncbi:hypothetical protein LTR85_003678 [Meristemomyces frigidus]|nr:hypothetical protein LTR85_003678 [Meristemomyces frigidus]